MERQTEGETDLHSQRERTYTARRTERVTYGDTEG
jgi:hypothetical protein